MRATLALAGLLATAGAASADQNDLTLERLIGMPSMPGVINDPSTIIQQSQFRSLMSELGVVMSPKFLSPADTLGWSGFQLSFDTSFTQISNKADFWQKGVSQVSGGFLPTISVFARKGLWLPLPSIEIGAGGTKLLDSEMYALQLYIKFALHEGFHHHDDWLGVIMPSIAVRGAVSHLFGSTQVDMTVISVDASLSKSFGIAGVLKLDPYLGANVLLNIVRSGVIDTTPNVDAFKQGPQGPDLNANTTFPDPDTIVRWRLTAGFRLVYWRVALTGEFSYILCNDTGSSCGVQNPTKITDRSDGQAQLSFSASMIF
jgi:hypothetical protein